MLKLRTLLAVAILSAMCGFAIAQPEGPEGGPQMTPPPGGPQGQRVEREFPGNDFFKAIKATEEQIAKLKPILEAQKNKMREWRQSNKEKFEAARKAMQEARESTDKDAAAKAKEQIKALAEEGKKLQDQFLKDISTVLSEEQIELGKKFFQNKAGHRMREMRGGEKGRDMFKQLDLTEEQRTKIKSIMDEARSKAQAAENPEAKRETMEAARKKINSEVLTADQKAKLETMKPERKKGPERRRPEPRNMNPLEGIATPEQMEQAKKIMDEAHEKAAEIMKAARKKINDEVLTEEQRKALQEKMEQFKNQQEKIGHIQKGFDGRAKRGPRPEATGCPEGDDNAKCAAPAPRGRNGHDGKMRKPRQDFLMSVMNEDQKTQAKKILDDAREKAKAAKTPEEKREIIKAAREKISKEILNDEQRKALEEKRKAAKKAPATSFADDEDGCPMECGPAAPGLDDGEL